jgi:transposase
MPTKKEATIMTAVQRGQINELLNGKGLTKRVRDRLRLLLYAADGMSDYAINKILGLDAGQIGEWRKRWEGSGQMFKELEKQPESKKELKAQIIATMSDRGRIGRPAQISIAQKNEIIAVACKSPKDYDIPIAAWNLTTLTQVIKDLKIVDEVSRSYVGKILQKKNFDHTG